MQGPESQSFYFTVFLSHVPSPWGYGEGLLDKEDRISEDTDQAKGHTSTEEPIIGKREVNHVIQMTTREVNKGWNFPERCSVEE